MTENKQFTFDRDTVAPNIKTPIVFKEGERLSIGEVLDKLNELSDENKQIKHIIQEAYETERTAIGKNVLKQLLNNIGETNE